MKKLLLILTITLHSILSFSQSSMETKYFWFNSTEIHKIYRDRNLRCLDTVTTSKNGQIGILYECPVPGFPLIGYIFRHDSCVAIDYFFKKKFKRELIKTFKHDYIRITKDCWISKQYFIYYIKMDDLDEYDVMELQPLGITPKMKNPRNINDMMI